MLCVCFFVLLFWTFFGILWGFLDTRRERVQEQVQERGREKFRKQVESRDREPDRSHREQDEPKLPSRDKAPMSKNMTRRKGAVAMTGRRSHRSEERAHRPPPEASRSLSGPPRVRRLALTPSFPAPTATGIYSPSSQACPQRRAPQVQQDPTGLVPALRVSWLTRGLCAWSLQGRHSKPPSGRSRSGT